MVIGHNEIKVKQVWSAHFLAWWVPGNETRYLLAGSMNIIPTCSSHLGSLHSPCWIQKDVKCIHIPMNWLDASAALSEPCSTLSGWSKQSNTLSNWVSQGCHLFFLNYDSTVTDRALDHTSCISCTTALSPLLLIPNMDMLSGSSLSTNPLCSMGSPLQFPPTWMRLHHQTHLPLPPSSQYWRSNFLSGSLGHVSSFTSHSFSHNTFPCNHWGRYTCSLSISTLPISFVP